MLMQWQVQSRHDASTGPAALASPAILLPGSVSEAQILLLPCPHPGHPAGKSALINRLLGRRMVDSAPKPGVTRQVGGRQGAAGVRLAWPAHRAAAAVVVLCSRRHSLQDA